MKLGLSLRLGQQLRMTPQLQQAIKLLQLSTFDLQQEIQEALDSNLMLEEAPLEGEGESDADGETTSLDTPEETIDGQAAAMEAETDLAQTAMDGDDQPAPPNPEIDGESIPDTREQITSDNISDELPVDSLWEDVWDDVPLPSSYSAPDENSDNYLENQNSSTVSLQSHLEEQLNMLDLSDVDQLIAMAIIDGLDFEGVLTISLDDVLVSMQDEFQDVIEIEMDEVEAVLHLIQHLDPVGVAARDLKECLTIQLNQLPQTTPWRKETLLVVQNYLPMLANRDYAYLIRKSRLKEPELKAVISLIQTLNPRPGADISPPTTEYVEPDVIVTKQNGRWVVELNSKSAPRIRVNSGYAAMVKRADSSSDNTYLKNNLQEARWFIKSLQQRNDTLLKVSTKIVEYQRGFLEYGEQAMKPLVLHDIADAVDLHESTISRVTTQKYMHTPAGVFELKYFFSSHVSTHAGGEVSSTAIRALIKKLVTEENPRKPLSDSKIVNLLAEQEIKVARRTIAKYRESLMIPPSNERKQLV
ncbi:MAG TPA: RNA polymerase factor sigma-54 [Gammaproteobacteria bacterium]|nr:RNA polymerase factor sigma-54 [Gammaproteobacteria bacterium]HIL98671.1 RNA polymerase factor sigma-54 [Pseudomonadales bacterium]